MLVTDREDGSTLTLTTRSGNVQELRRRAVNLAADYNAGFDNQAPPVDQPYIQAPRRLEGGPYGVRGGEGIKYVEIPGRPPSRAVVEVIPYGAKIHYRTNSPSEVRYVRARAAREAVQMWAGSCPTVG